MRQTAHRAEAWSRRGRLARARVALASGILGCAAVAALALPLGGPLTGNVAIACGLGAGPTMLANNTPALLYPVTGNVPANQPVGIFAPDYAANTPISLSEDLSRAPGAPDPNSLKWRWSFGDGTTSTGAVAPSHTYKKPGNYNIHSQFYDASSKTWTDLDSAQIHVVASVPANPPVARATESSSLAFQDSSITFDASHSTSADGSALTYFWNFNDGQTATGVRVDHQFAITGKGFVSLTVTDGHGAKGVTTIDIIVPQSQLKATAQSIAPGRSITFNEDEVGTPTNNGAPVPGQQVSFAWHFADGTPDQVTAQPTIAHTFAHAGQYIVTLQETDGQAAGPFEAVLITVAVPPPPPWRYYAGGGAVALGILVSLLAAVRSQRRQIKLAEERKAAREMARARRVGPSYGGRSGGRGGYDEYDDYAPRGRRGDDYPPGRSRSPGGSSGRWADDRGGGRSGGGRDQRQNRQRGGPPPRGRSRDDRW